MGEIYGKQNCTSLNSLRVHKAELKVSTKHTPPIDDSCKLHVLYCKYQLMDWERAKLFKKILPDPARYAYYKDQTDQTLHPLMMAQSPVAPELLNEIFCECYDDCDENC